MKKILKAIVISCFIFSSARFFDIGTSPQVNAKMVINHEDDEDYSYLCGDGESDLTVIEDEDNMMDPNNLNISTGKVSLKEDIDLIVNDDAYYTFVIYLSDASNVREINYGSGNCIKLEYTPVNIDNSIETFSISDDAPQSASPTELFNSGSSQRLNLYSEKFNRLFMEFHIPRTESYCRRVKITSFCFAFNVTGSCGKVEHVQLYKSKMDLSKPWVEYNHEPRGISDDSGGPYEDGYIYNISINYGSKLTVDDLKNSLSAYDFGDGEFHDVKLVSDNYTDNRDTLETNLDVVFSSTDSRGNTSTFTYRIVITDSVPPEISPLEEKLCFSYTDTLTEEKLLSCFSFSDNYLDEIDSRRITDFNFNLGENYIGKINFTVEASDISGNICTLDASAEIIDDIAPEINGEDEIVIKAGEKLTDEEIISHYSATDEIDGQTEVTIKCNNLEGNYNSIGIYTCEIESKDSSNNVATKTIFLQVVDSTGPSFYVNEGTITQFGSHMISSDEVVESLVRSNQLPKKNYVYSEFLYGNYQGKNGEIEIGTYNEKVAAHADDGSIEYASVTIIVKSEEQNISKHKVSFWEKIALWFVNLWKAIRHFFSRLFNFN